MKDAALKQIIDLIQPVAALGNRIPFENSEVIQRCVDATEIALEALAQPAQRTWVGLDEKDFSAINQSCLTKLQAATSAESILKEKNT